MPGLIPARAGNTDFLAILCPPWGSSPLARGTHWNPCVSQAGAGLIPARAGNTIRTRPHGGFCRAHPRSRGEHPRTVWGAGLGWGSSPLARGTLRYSWSVIGFSGLIPARAGNTGWKSPPQESHRAHPRSRGEHAGGSPPGAGSPGSSPLARGTLFCLWVFTDAPGLIPARAGNTRYSSFHSRRGRAHPRSRGEHLCILHRIPIIGGSSPLARGTLM